jgi:hypothetical protein
MVSRAKHFFEPSITAPGRLPGSMDRGRRTAGVLTETGLTFSGDVPGYVIALRTNNVATLWHEAITRVWNAPLAIN